MGIINAQELKEAIHEASKGTYASGKENIKEKQADGSTTIRYQIGDYAFHDNYFGGEPYGGREVIFFKHKPLWMMVYYGFVHPGTSPSDVYPFLMESLRNSTLDKPYRGPEFFEAGNFRYENKVLGGINRFSGTEKIFKDTICV
jgi:hypothetical protein